MLATAVNGNQTNQTFTVTYSDSTTDTFTLSLSDWTTPQSYSGEVPVVTMNHRNNSDGTSGSGPVYLSGYTLNLNPAKVVQSLTLPNNSNVALLAATLTNLTQTSSSVYDTFTTPAAPVLTQTSGGSLPATTYYVKLTYVVNGVETPASPESSLAVSANNLLTVSSPASSLGATGYNVYVATATGQEVAQNGATPIALGTNWTEPTTGLVTGTAAPHANGVGDGNLTQRNLYPSGNPNPGGAPPADSRVNLYSYDGRDRLVAEKDGALLSTTSPYGPKPAGETDLVHRPVFVTSYDNLGEPTQRQCYDGHGASVGVDGSGNVILSNAPGFTQTQTQAQRLRAQAAQGYDEQGRVYQDQVFDVGPTDGALANSALLTNYYYNHRGEQMAVSAPGGLWTKTSYDGAGRPTFGYNTDGAGGVAWSAAASVSNDTVLEQSQQLYDGASNVVATISSQRFDNATGTGPLGNATTSPTARVSYMATYYDAADRPIASVNLGSNPLPAGLTLSSAGVLSGTPSSPGVYNFTVTGSGTGGQVVSRAYSLTVNAAITLSPATLPAATVGSAYSQTLSASGGAGGPYTFALAAGSTPPAGLSLSSAGVLTGTPSVAGAFTFTVQATDSGGGSATWTYTLACNSSGLSLSPASLPSGTTGTAYSQSLSVTGASGSIFAYTVSAGTLPPGLTLLTGNQVSGASTGLLSGTPTTTGSFTFTITATCASGTAAGQAVSQAYTLTVSAPVLTLAPATLPSASAGSAYSQSLSVTGGTGAFSFATTGWARPATVPGRSDTTLVTSDLYNAGGWVQDMLDPRESSPGQPLTTRTLYNALGRTVKTVLNYTGNPEPPTSPGYDTSTFVRVSWCPGERFPPHGDFMPNHPDSRPDRRDVLKSVSLGAGLAVSGLPLALSVEAAAETPAHPGAKAEAPDFARSSAALEPDRIVASACQFCNSLCRLQVHLKAGRIVSIQGEDKDPVQAGELCVKANLMTQLVYNRFRLTRPLQRIGGAKGSADSKFAPITWDQALEIIARKLLELRDAGEARSIASKTSGRLPRGTGSLIHRLFTLLGSPNDTDVGPVCNDAGGNALAWTFGLGNFTNGYGVDGATGKEDLGSARCFLFLGTNQAETHPVTFAHLLRCRQATGAKLVVIDPRKTPTAAFADHWLAPKPHTDLALVLALLYHIIDRKLYDSAFIDRWVLGFDELAKHLKTNGYTPEWAAKVCDIPGEQIRATAEQYARAKPAAIFCNAGISHQLNAFDTYRALTFLAAITGNIGVPGGGCNFMHNTWPGDLHLPPVGAKTPAIKDPALPVGPDWFAESILAGKPYRLEAVFLMGNPILGSANTKRVREAYARLDFCVYTGLFMEESAYFADVILPVCSGLEMDGVYMRRDDRAIRWQEAAVPRVGESRPDWEIWIELAHALGRLDKKNLASYWTAAFPKEWKDYRKLWATFVERTPGMGGMSAERMAKRAEPLRWPCPTEKHPGVSTLYLDHPTWQEAATALGQKGKRFLTPSGKVEITTAELEKKLAPAGHGALPIFYTHPEVTGANPTIEYTAELVANPVNPGAVTPKVKLGVRSKGAIHEEYPLMGMIGRPSVVHFAGVTQWTYTGKQMNGVRLIQIHPNAAKRAGVKNGDAVVVESPRGAVTGTALVWEGMREDVVFVPNTFGPAQKLAAEFGLQEYEPANLLTDDRYFDNLSGQQAYKCFACRVRKG